MANLVNLETVSKSFGIQPLLESVSLGVQTGERIGVVGLNGGGKTTLLEIMAGIEEPDSGRVSRATDLRMAVVTQRGELPAGTVADVVLGPLGVAEHEWAGDTRIRDVLSGIGIGSDHTLAEGTLDLHRDVSGLSGGERRRVALAAALVRELDLLILDEPTNHLDVEGVQWLADHLVRRRSSLVVVTHDRWFLDTVATRTWEVAGGAVNSYEGGYNDWVFARAERDRQADASEERRRNLARKELAWLRRGAPARTSKPRYRMEAAEALIADVPAPRDSVALAAFAQRRLGRVVIELEDVRLEAPDGRVLVDDLTWRLAPGERVGLVGVNGSGKTTLLRALAGDIATPGAERVGRMDAPAASPILAAGRRVQGQTVRLGWLKQELDDLDGDMRLLAAVEEVAGRIQLGDKEISAGQLAERLGFTPARQRTPVRDLSGGERRRLQLTRVLMAEPNVLLLDEPTNDLDIDTLQQLEDLLDSWGGTLVVISHDRYLIERICDSTWALFGDGHLTNLPGGIEEYLRRRAQLTAGLPAAHAAQVAEAAAAVPSESAAPDDAPARPRDAKAEQQARKEMNRLERQLTKLSAEEDGLHARLAEAATDPDRLIELDGRLRDVVAEKETAEMRWLELAEDWG
ncbi:ABC-F family ATP-binding cassette domain-containing protein [Tsukamurella soli]|uniref:ABC-F family ATP-binding cassette domain-containing protein n=1 Tax=Tsukamurella soli TaxID=644556 RepID=A0ABP8JZW8_9ACTN